MARRLMLELIGDPTSLLRSFEKSSVAANTFGADLKTLGITAEQSARKRVEASVKADARIRQEIRAYQELAASAVTGSREQIAALNLLAAKQAQLARSTGATTAEQAAFAASTRRTERDLGKVVRGAAAGSGIFGHLGRSLAFASGAFLIYASGTQIIRESLQAATESAATERQLAAQFRAAGLDVKDYHGRIEDATLATSRLSGFNRDELTKSFLTAFRGSQNVSVALKIQGLAADVARGRGIQLGASTLALTKVYGGLTTALRRLGILVPTNLRGMAALEFVQRRFAGQAESGATAQERFSAAIYNTQVSIGQALLPTFTRLAEHTTAWLDDAEHQAAIQRDVSEAVRTGGEVFHGFETVLRGVLPLIQLTTRALGGTERAVTTLLQVLIARRLIAFAEAEGLIAANATKATAAIEGMEAAAAAAPAAGAAGAAGGAAAGAAGGAAGGGAAATAGEVAGGVAGGSLLARILGRAAPLARRVARIGTVTVLVDLVLNEQDRQKVKKAMRDAVTGGEPSDRAGGIFIPTPAGGFTLFSHRVQPPLPTGGFGFRPVPGMPLGLLPPVTEPSGTLVGVSPPAERGPLGFRARMQNEQLRLAQAQLTETQADDRRILAAEAALIRERIKHIEGKRKHLGEQIELTNQLVNIEGQIASIDQNADQAIIGYKRLELRLAQAQLTQTQSDDLKILQAQAALVRQQIKTLGHSQKTLDARIALTQQLGQIEGQIASINQGQLDALEQQKQKQQQHLANLQQREQDLRGRIRAIQDSFNSAVETARQAIGELFKGPVVQPSPDELKKRLGVIFAATDPEKLLADLRTQTQQYAAFERNLARLRRRGAPAELIRELQAAGMADAGEAAALARAPTRLLRQIFAAFRTRERLAINSARTVMRAQLVTLHADRVALAGVRRAEQRVKVEIQVTQGRVTRVRTRQNAITSGRAAGR